MLVKSEDRIRRGLVLAGGGAKGAYAYGCLKVFHKHQLKFDVVAGTSAGALNAALWATQSFDIGDRIWPCLSFSTILPPRWRPPVPVPRWCYYIEGASRLLIHLVRASRGDVRHPLHLPCCVVNFALLTIVPFIGIAVALPIIFGLDPLRALEPPLPHWFMAFIGIVGPLAGSVASALVLFTETYGHERALSLRFALYAAFFGSFFAFLLVLGKNEGHVNDWLVWSFAFTLIVIICFFPTSYGVETRRTTFVPDVLRNTVESVAKRPFLAPTLICMAQLKEVYRGYFWRPPKSIFLKIAVTRPEWIPTYVDVSAQSAQAAAEVLLASAALPFGLLPAVDVDGTHFVDGGVVDNVPLLPLLGFDLDEVILILLEPATKIEQLVKDCVAMRERIARAQIPVPNDPEDSSSSALPLIPLQSKAFRLITVSPSSSLGGYLNGTLNFDGAYARKLMARGEADAEALIARGLTGTVFRFVSG